MEDSDNSQCTSSDNAQTSFAESILDAKFQGSEDIGEDLLESVTNDYRAIPELDTYSHGDTETDINDDVSNEARQKVKNNAEKEMDFRDQIIMEKKYPSKPDSSDEIDLSNSLSQKQNSSNESGTEKNKTAFEIPIDCFVGNLREFLGQERVKNEVGNKFKSFLRTFEVDGKKVYINHINEVARLGSKSLEVDYTQLASVHPTLCMWVADAPTQILQIFNRSASSLFEELFPSNFLESPKIFIRMSNIPICDSLKDVRQIHLNNLVRVSGVVVKRTSVFPQLVKAIYNCNKCHFHIGPIAQNNIETESKPNCCANCQSKGPFLFNEEESIYRNYQKIKLQELPGTVAPGRLPRSKEVILLNDLIDSTRPGEEIEITGIYLNIYDASLNLKNSFPIFNTVIEANHLRKKDDENIKRQISYEDQNEILNLSRQTSVAEQISMSIAPFIYGHINVKTALALALFGGCEKSNGKHRLRGDINILLLGDPGMAKSQFLKYVEKTAYRVVYATGKGASAVGLTASVHKDPITNEWALEGGALVLADRGVCLIDEFNNMNDQDRVSIHEAMEQQSISISKAGIVTQLQARCSVIAAANPINGKYDPSKSFSENVELSDPIISRFDILCVIKDIVDPSNDEQLAKFVVNSHAYSSLKSEHATNTESHQMIPRKILSKYIRYAKENIRPELRSSEDEKIAVTYVKLRKESTNHSGMPIAVRHLESIIRISEAHARMHLREFVSSDDVDLAIKIMVESYISAQRYGAQKFLQRKFRQFTIYKVDEKELFYILLKELLRNQLKLEIYRGFRDFDDLNDTFVRVDLSQLIKQLKEYNIDNIHRFLCEKQFYDEGFSLSEDRKYILHRR
jgi:DNA replication licensing factor MCM2